MSASLFSGCKKNNDNSQISTVTFSNSGLNFYSVGAWWWDDQLDAETYLEFAKKNSITEIYYCSSKFNDTTSEFIKKANQKNIKVFYLDGDYRWISNHQSLLTKISNYVIYQEKHPTTKFAGIHLDIEPHQDPNFETNRESLITKLVKLAKTLGTLYPEINFDYDIPFWLDDEIEDVLGGSSEKIAAYKQMISISSRTFVMSYRDTAEKIYDVSKDELEYATQVGKKVILGVETKSTEGDNVSFMEESKTIMYAELTKLAKLVPDGTGITFHQIKTWYDLAD